MLRHAVEVFLYKLRREAAEGAAEVAYLARPGKPAQRLAHVGGRGHGAHAGYRTLVAVDALPAAARERKEERELLQHCHGSASAQAPFVW